MQFNQHIILAGMLVVSMQTSFAAVLPEIIVSATRSEQSDIPTAANITVINRAEIENSGAAHLADLLRNRSGIQIRDLFGDGSQTEIDMRGFGSTASSNTLVLVDGRTLNNSADIGGPDLTTINLYDIERIEIIEGSAGVLYGNQAVGGVINIITQQAKELTINGEVGIGSYNQKKITASIANSIDNGLYYRISGSKKASDNYRDNNKIDTENLYGKIGLNYYAGSVFLEAQGINNEQEIPGALFKSEIQADREQVASDFAQDYSETTTKTLRLGIRHALSDTLDLDIDFTRRESDREFLNSFRGFAGSKATQDREIYSFNPRIIKTIETEHGTNSITLGADLENTDYELNTSFGPQIDDQKIKNYFAQGVIQLNSNLAITAGIRHARVKNKINIGSGNEHLNDDITIGSLGASFVINNQLRIFARADQNFRFAKVDEHTNPVFGQPIGLKNQSGITYEIGGSFKTNHSSVKAQIYRIDIDDEISYDSQQFANINIDSTERKGLTLSANHNLNNQFSLGGSLSLIDTRITNGTFQGNDIPMVANKSFRLFTHFQITEKTRLGAEIISVDDQVVGADFDNTVDKLDSYALLNLNTSHNYKQWSISAKLNNVLNKEYSQSASHGLDALFQPVVGFFPSPKRNFWLTAKYTFK